MRWLVSLSLLFVVLPNLANARDTDPTACNLVLSPSQTQDLDKLKARLETFGREFPPLAQDQRFAAHAGEVLNYLGLHFYPRNPEVFIKNMRLRMGRQTVYRALFLRDPEAEVLRASGLKGGSENPFPVFGDSSQAVAATTEDHAAAVRAGKKLYVVQMDLPAFDLVADKYSNWVFSVDEAKIVSVTAVETPAGR